MLPTKPLSSLYRTTGRCCRPLLCYSRWPNSLAVSSVIHGCCSKPKSDVSCLLDQVYWAKDLFFVVAEKQEIGMQAWLNAYHGMPNNECKSIDMMCLVRIIYVSFLCSFGSPRNIDTQRSDTSSSRTGTLQPQRFDNVRHFVQYDQRSTTQLGFGECRCQAGRKDSFASDHIRHRKSCNIHFPSSFGT